MQTSKKAQTRRASKKSRTTSLLFHPPVTFRLPKPGAPDPYFGFSRAFFYEGHKLGYWKFIRICGPGKRRGVTLIPYAAVAAFIEKQGRAQ
jgi:hypothetical protein